jgi:hypothetical protein
MHISLRAKQLLDEGDVLALQALSYEELLPESIRQEILDGFLNPCRAILPGDSVAQMMLDPTSYESLTDACVVSSGQIFSRSAIEALVNSRTGRQVNCPITRSSLNLNIGRTGLAYVLLPKIDEVIRGYRALHVAKPASQDLLLRSFSAPKTSSFSREDRGMHSAMGALHYAPLPKKNINVVPTTPPLFKAQNVVGTFEVKVARNRLRIVVIFDYDSDNAFSDQLKYYFEKELPNSQVINSGGSYSMSKNSFGRCWKIRSNGTFELELWFPLHKSLEIPAQNEEKTTGDNELQKKFHDNTEKESALNQEVNLESVTAEKSTSKKETFSDDHLNTLIKQFSKIMGLAQATVISEELQVCSIKNIPRKEYRVVMEKIPATYEQIRNCCQIFLNRTQIIANNLHLPINDAVITHSYVTSASITSGLTIFGTPDDAATSSSLMSRL